jgi:hypothetical protein
MPRQSHDCGDLWRTSVETTCYYWPQVVYTGKPDNVNRPSGVRIENNLQLRQPVEVKSANDLTVEVLH